MKKICIYILIICLFYPNIVYANIMCNDGSISPSCSDCHRGCCSHHGGCANNYIEEDYYDEEDNNFEKKDNSLLYLLTLGGIGTMGYYIFKKREK